ncbi:MAG TPA: hypothetical protein VKT82_26295 [Ktedonobacterales bacterium]|nr:hypothetical protein [Ktedonobacterales bacterium]
MTISGWQSSQEQLPDRKTGITLVSSGMDKVYYLDLQTLLEYLEGQSALLFTEVTVPGRREPCMGYLFWKSSTLIGCLIQVASDVVWLEGEQAYQLLKGNNEWRVRMDLDIEQTFWLMKQRSGGAAGPRRTTGGPADARQITSPQRSAPNSYAPRPLMSLDAALLNQFPTKERLILRMVYALVNGQRTPAQIKAQLRLPPESVDEALRSLHALRVIE